MYSVLAKNLQECFSKNGELTCSILEKVAHLPEEITNLRRWVLWKYEWRQNKKGGRRRTKVLYQVWNDEYYPAKANDLSTANSLQAVLRSLRDHEGMDGIGFILGGGYAGVDLDNCLENGEFRPWAKEIFDNLNSYSEISPSLNGVKILVKGQKPNDFSRDKPRCKHIINAETREVVEIFDVNRFFTITGNSFNGLEIAERSNELEKLYFHLFSQKEKIKPREGGGGTHSGLQLKRDLDIIKLASEARNGEKFKKLLNGHDLIGDTSADDMSFVEILCFYTQDKEQIARIWRESKRSREKLNRDDYVFGTINNCLAKMTKFYEHLLSFSEEEISKICPEYSPPEQTKPVKNHFNLKRRSDLNKIKPMEWLVEKHIHVGKILEIYGEFGLGKSFYVQHMVASICTGLPFLNKFYVKKGRALYICAESGDGLKKRMAAWEKYYNNGEEISDDDLIVIDEAFCLLETQYVNNLIEDIKNNGGVDLVVVDTVSAMFGGNDDNSQKDMGIFVTAINKITRSCNCAGILVHHPGKDLSRGSRGANKLPGACDSIIEISGSSQYLDIACKKLKETRAFDPYCVKSTVIKLEETIAEQLGIEDDNNSSLIFEFLNWNTQVNDKNANFIDFILNFIPTQPNSISVKDLLAQHDVCEHPYIKKYTDITKEKRIRDSLKQLETMRLIASFTHRNKASYYKVEKT